MRTCKTCKKKLQNDDFYREKKNRDGLSCHCKDCVKKRLQTWRASPENKAQAQAASRDWYSRHKGERKAYNAKYQKTHREYELARRLKKRYGVDLVLFKELLEKQKGRCASCGEEGRLVVDHDHRTGAVRGLLCTGCNVSIGHLKESPEKAAALAVYLRKHLTDPAKPGRVQQTAFGP